MTRLAILADIHGNLPALEAVMADLAGRRVEQVIVAGDLINWGRSRRKSWHGFARRAGRRFAAITN